MILKVKDLIDHLKKFDPEVVMEVGVADIRFEDVKIEEVFYDHPENKRILITLQDESEEEKRCANYSFRMSEGKMEMGCHTWFPDQINLYMSREEAIQCASALLSQAKHDNVEPINLWVGGRLTRKL